MAGRIPASPEAGGEGNLGESKEEAENYLLVGLKGSGRPDLGVARLTGSGAWRRRGFGEGWRAGDGRGASRRRVEAS